MASQNKKNKLKNAFLHKSFLKNKEGRLKRVFFYTASERKAGNKVSE